MTVHNVTGEKVEINKRAEQRKEEKERGIDPKVRERNFSRVQRNKIHVCLSLTEEGGSSNLRNGVINKPRQRIISNTKISFYR
jgi:hypothetical protein